MNTETQSRPENENVGKRRTFIFERWAYADARSAQIKIAELCDRYDSCGSDERELGQRGERAVAASLILETLLVRRTRVRSFSANALG